MIERLRQLGVLVGEAGPTVALRCAVASREWLLRALPSLGVAVTVIADGLTARAPDPAALERALVTALAPQACLFDLDGVLADIGARRAIDSPAALARIAASHRVAVVTTCPRRLALSVLERHGFGPFVQAVIGSEDGPCKPDPFPVRLALERLGATTAWMLGDNPSDVVAARRAGVLPLAIAPHGIGADSHRQELLAAGAVALPRDLRSLHELLAALPTPTQR